MRNKAKQNNSVKAPVQLPLLEKLALRIPEAVALSGLSRTKLYALIAAGELPSRKIAGCRVIVTDDLRRFITEPTNPASRQ